MPMRCQAQRMPLPQAILTVIHDRRSCSAASVQPQWQHREFYMHLSVKGADRLCSHRTRHKGEPKSHRHFILVHMVAPRGPARLWLSGELNRITAIALKLPSESLTRSTHMYILTMESFKVNENLSSVGRTRKRAAGGKNNKNKDYAADSLAD